MGLIRNSAGKPFIEAPIKPEGLSKSAKASMLWFLVECEPEMPVSAARGVIRARHGLHVEQEIRAFVAGLSVKGQEHNVRPVKGEPHRYEVESRSNPNEHYIVDIEELTCACRSYEIRKWCGHIDSAIAFKTGEEDAR